MIKTALIGHPLGHSLSKVIHTAAYKSVGLEGKYELFDVAPEKIASTIEMLKKDGFSGFNVTIPYKVEVKQYLQLWDMLVDYAGCTNCVKIKPDGAMYGYNTDIFGFTEAILPEKRESLAGKRALILGNGGAARAVAVALIMMKIGNIDFFVRNLDKASPLQELMQTKFKNTTCNLLQKISDISSYSIIINATPLGTKGENVAKLPISASILAEADKSAIVYDLVYNPTETMFIKTAKDIGLTTIGGLDMLVYQAQKAFKIFTGKLPDFNEMKDAALMHL